MLLRTHKVVKVLEKLHFDDYEEFAVDVSERYDEIKEDDDLDSIDVVGKYKDIKEIMANIIGLGYGIAFIKDFTDPEWYDYKDEFILSLSNDEVWCEPARRDSGYVRPEAKIVYLLDDCNSKIIHLIEADEIYEVEIDNHDCGGDCENCDLSVRDNIYKVNGKEVSEKEYDTAIEKFHDKYMDNVANTLLSYYEFKNEMDEFRKLFRW